MGNQLVGVAPSQIFPVEHYLTGSFESDLQYESRWVEKCSKQLRVGAAVVDGEFIFSVWAVRAF